MEMLKDDTLISGKFVFEYMSLKQDKYKEKANEERIFIDLNQYDPSQTSLSLTDLILLKYSIPENLKIPLFCRIRLHHTIKNQAMKNLVAIT